jgi:L-fucose mutarotase
MLKNVHPLLTPELLHVLALMGHGDDLVVCDANFPADSVARSTVHGRAVPLAGADAPTAVGAILSVYPLDTFVETPALRMAPDDTPHDQLPAVQREVQAIVDADAGRPLPLGPVERFAFYDLARRAYAVVATGERRFWGCFVLKKGVIPPG